MSALYVHVIKASHGIEALGCRALPALGQLSEEDMCKRSIDNCIYHGWWLLAAVCTQDFQPGLHGESASRLCNYNLHLLVCRMLYQVQERGFTQQFQEYWVERAIGEVKVRWLRTTVCLDYT